MGIEVGATTLRGGCWSDDRCTRRELPVLVARGEGGRWEVGLRARAAALTGAAGVAADWASLLTLDAEGGARDRLGRLLVGLRTTVEESLPEVGFGSAVLAAPSRWAVERYSELRASVQMMGLTLERVLGRSDAVTLGMSDVVKGTVLTLTVDADGVEAAVFEVEAGSLHAVARVRATTYNLAAIDALLVTMALPKVDRDDRAEALWVIGNGRAALLRGEEVTVATLREEPDGGVLRLREAQRRSVLDVITDAAVAAAREAMSGLATAPSVVLVADVLSEVDELATRLEHGLGRRVVRAEAGAAVSGAARFAWGLHRPESRWHVRDGLASAARFGGATGSMPPPSAGPSWLKRPSLPPPSVPVTVPPATGAEVVPAPAAVVSLLPPAPTTKVSSRPSSGVFVRGDAEVPQSVPVSRPSMIPSMPPGQMDGVMGPAAVSLATSGSFVGLSDAASWATLPTLRPPTYSEEPWMLPLLLLRIEKARAPRAVLTLTAGRRSFAITFEQGRPTLAANDRSVLREVFLWKEGTWTLSAGGAAVASPVVQWSLFGFLVEGLQAVLRASTQAELEAVVVGHRAEAPKVTESRRWVVAKLGLSDRERRMLDIELDGGRSLEALLQGGTSSRSTLLQLLVMLSAFDAVSYQPVVAKKVVDAGEALRAKRSKLEGASHFEVLEVHWSASPHDIEAAWKEYEASYRPGSEAARSAPDDAAALLALGAAAWAVLRSDRSRVEYTRVRYPNVSFDMLAPLVQGRVMALSMQKGAARELEDARRLLRELSPSLAQETDRVVLRR